MGYPVITRLGVSQFWYHHWYSDKTYFLNTKQDRLLLELIKLYLDYGLSFQHNIFFHEYYFSPKLRKRRVNQSILNLRYFRRFFFSNYTLGIEHSYFLRYHSGEYFPFRFWLMRHSGWIIVCFNCFKPVKIKPNKKNFIKRESSALGASLVLKKSTNRAKLFYLYLRFALSKKYKYGF
jgi:hypothetical protein